MTKRKARRPGSIEPWGTGDNCWRVRLTFPGGQRFNRIVHGSKAEAEALLDEQLKRKRGGEREPLRRQRVRVWVQEYIDHYCVGITDRTKQGYDEVLQRYVLPVLGELYLDRLTRRDIQRFIAGLVEQGLSPRTVRQAHTVLSTCLHVACDEDRISRNPAIRNKLPAQAVHEPTVLTIAEIGRVLDKAAGAPLEALWYVLLDAGLRVNEAMALQWGDIANGVVTVRRSLLHPKGGGWKFGPTKTKRQRPVPLGRDTLAAIEQHRAKQAVDQLVAGDRWRKLDLIFTDEHGEPLFLRGVREQLAALLTAAECPAVTMRDLRHTCLTEARAVGDIKDASERGGHSDISITAKFYAAASTERQGTVASLMEARRAAHRKLAGA